MSTLLRSSAFFPRKPTRSCPFRCSRRWLGHDTVFGAAQTFRAIGLSKPVVDALEETFPNVKEPTVIQSRFIRAILSGQDVLLKDETGTGKSFGLLLALLSAPRQYATTEVRGRLVKNAAIGSLFITPHRDLAYQLQHWTRCLQSAGALKDGSASMLQVLVRGAQMPVGAQVRHINQSAPQIVVATPQAVMEALKLEDEPLNLRGLSLVAVDEADFLLETRPKGDKHAVAKYEKQIKRHPTPTQQLLDAIYRRRQGRPQEVEEATRSKWQHGGMKSILPQRRPQLVLASATLKAAFRHTVMTDGGWLTERQGGLAKIIARPDINDDNSEKAEDRAALGGHLIQHSGVVVAQDGAMSNIKGAVDVPADSSQMTSSDLPSLVNDDASEAFTSDPEQDTSKFAKEVSPFNSVALEAIATVFALEVPRVALLVLHGSAPVERAVYDLRTLGVNAHGLDVLDSERGGAYLLQKGTSPAANPALLVSTLATTRGLDLPDLTHVFVLAPGDALDNDVYLHAAGRVGRFGRGGKVITVVEAPHVVRLANGKTKSVDEPNRLQRIYKRIGITPVKLEHFESAEANDSDAGRPTEAQGNEPEMAPVDRTE